MLPPCHATVGIGVGVEAQRTNWGTVAMSWLMGGGQAGVSHCGRRQLAA